MIIFDVLKTSQEGHRRVIAMEASTYDSLQESATSHGLNDLPPWADLPADTQELVLRVLRRRDVARTLDGQEDMSPLERDVGVGEDRALRLHLLLTAVEALGAGAQGEPSPKAEKNGNGHGASPDAGAFGYVFTELLDEQTRAHIAGDCWVYRADPLIPWDGLQHVQTGFEAAEGTDVRKLAEARRAWDELPEEQRLVLVAAGLRAVMLEYTHGHLPYPVTSRSIWGNAVVLRKLRTAAEKDRMNLLSDTAFESLASRELPHETFQGVDVLLDGDEAFVRRSALPAAELPAWSQALAAWKPAASDDGEAVFAWKWGGAVAVPDRPLAEHLESWIDVALAHVATQAAA